MSSAEQVIPDLTFKKDLQEIDGLQEIFNSFLKQRPGHQILSYNPVLERWRYEQIVSEADEISFRNHEEKQIETALRERLRTAKSSVHYKIEGGRAKNELFPNEPFDTILKRGIEYRKRMGSTETEREQAELNGWSSIFEGLLNPETPVNSKFTVISGPGTVKETSYPHNFVDVYEKVKTPTGEIKVKMTRTISRTGYEKYREVIESFDSRYFERFSGPIDAWFLSHPIPGDCEGKLVTLPTAAMREEIFQEIFEICFPLILHYINVLCQDTFNPKEVVIAFNAILNKADDVKARIDQRKGGNTVQPLYIFRNIGEEAYFFGTRPVREVLAGCGLSAGFETADTSANSVARYGVNSQDGEWHVGTCKKCGFPKWVGGCNICASCVYLYFSKN